MAYVFKEDELPSLIDAKAARERIFFVNQELANIDDMLAGVMHYKKGAASPLHLHKNCEHFYFIIDGKATVELDDGIRPVGPGDMIFIPAEEKHRLRATEPLFYFEWQAPNRFKTTILEGTDDDLRWDRKDGKASGFRPDIIPTAEENDYVAHIHRYQQAPQKGIGRPRRGHRGAERRRSAGRATCMARCAGSNRPRRSSRMQPTSTSSST